MVPHPFEREYMGVPGSQKQGSFPSEQEPVGTSGEEGNGERLSGESESVSVLGAGPF